MLTHLRSLLSLVVVLSAALLVSSFEVSFSDADNNAQVCSGMWGGEKPFVNVSFEAGSQGQIAMVIYEWDDVRYLGKVTSSDEYMPKTYVCTSDAVRAQICDAKDLGEFIVNLPPGASINETSIWHARVAFRPNSPASAVPSQDNVAANPADPLWDNPEGNPPVPTEDLDFTSPWRRASKTRPRQEEGDGLASKSPEDDPSAENESNPPAETPSSQTNDGGVYWYSEPIHYPVRKTGYYCVAMVPITVLESASKRQSSDLPHPSYKGKVLFRNTFDGKLPAAEYPKVNFYLALTLVYVAVGGLWGFLCFRHIQDLLPIQYYVSSLAGFLIIEMFANWAYYRYLNAHGGGAASTAFLIVVTILDAGRNALSFFLLLVVCLGLSVVRESLGSTMFRCRLLAIAHFVFGMLYAVGLVTLEIETTSAFLLLLFVIPLAFTMSGFLLWIMYALNGTIKELAARKQRYKLSMFKKLNRILVGAVLVIAAFFVVSSLSFSNRYNEDFAPNSWYYRWWLLDGWLAILYLVVFISIAWLWRPTGSNRRLAMSDEIAQDEEDAEDYDLDALEHRGRLGDEEEGAYGRLAQERRESIADDGLVFEIGDDGQDSDDEDSSKRRRKERRSAEANRLSGEEEREGFLAIEREDVGRRAPKDRSD